MLPFPSIPYPPAVLLFHPPPPSLHWVPSYTLPLSNTSSNIIIYPLPPPFKTHSRKRQTAKGKNTSLFHRLSHLRLPPLRLLLWFSLPLSINLHLPQLLSSPRVLFISLDGSAIDLPIRILPITSPSSYWMLLEAMSSEFAMSDFL